MTNLSRDKTNNSDEWIDKFMAKQQKLADEAGVHLLVYMANEHGGLLKPTIIKMLKHVQAHPKECPTGCVYQASIRKLEKEFEVS